MPCYISTLSMKDESRKLRCIAVIEFLILESNQPAKIFERLGRVYCTNCPSYATKKCWNLKFWRGRQSISDDPCPGWPIEAVHDKAVTAVKKLVKSNRWVSVSQIATTVSISMDTVEKILNAHLGMNKAYVRWVPRMLTDQMKANRLKISREILYRIKNNH